MAIQRVSRSVADEAKFEVSEPSARLFTVDEYYRMAEVGILRPDERVQLIEGVIVQMPPIGPRHAFNVDRVADLFRLRVGTQARIRTQQPIRLASLAEPEPDIAIVRSYLTSPKMYETRHPGPDDVLVLIEIADSTLAFDLGEKAAMYAQSNVKELWVVDLHNDRMHVHREPTGDGYASVEVAERGMTVNPLAFPDVEFTADEILG